VGVTSPFRVAGEGGAGGFLCCPCNLRGGAAAFARNAQSTLRHLIAASNAARAAAGTQRSRASLGGFWTRRGARPAPASARGSQGVCPETAAAAPEFDQS